MIIFTKIIRLYQIKNKVVQTKEESDLDITSENYLD